MAHWWLMVVLHLNEISPGRNCIARGGNEELLAAFIFLSSFLFCLPLVFRKAYGYFWALSLYVNWQAYVVMILKYTAGQMLSVVRCSL